MPCNINNVSFPTPNNLAPPIGGLGRPFSLNSPNINPPVGGQPEDLQALFNALQFISPVGTFAAALSFHSGKDAFDSILKLLDQVFPFLMLYKFFLPVLNLLLCIIEVLCAIPNPFKVVSALNRLFTQCIPQFLSIFPQIAMIVMIISTLLLLLALVEYLISQILLLVESILHNIIALGIAFQDADANGVLLIAQKLGSLLCIFQNFFILLDLFVIIIEIIINILTNSFAIPPCEPSISSGCCTPDVCPTIVKQPYTNFTGTFQYLNEVGYLTTVVLPTGNLTVDLRAESWQLYDIDQTIAQAFINIIDGYDITTSTKPVFFPTDSTYTATTSPSQAAYTLNLRMFYNPTNWGRSGLSRFIQFQNCIMQKAPTDDLLNFDNKNIVINNGVVFLVGGLGFEDDGYTILTGFDTNGTTPISAQATLENFIHMPAEFATNPVLLSTDGYTFSNIQYTFTPNLPVLLQKDLITSGCSPDVAFSRTFVNNVILGDLGIKTAGLQALVNGNTFPNPGAASACLATALDGLRNNITNQGVADFQSLSTLCLTKLQNDTISSLNSLIGLGFDPCKSDFFLTPTVQFTTQPIVVSVNLNDSNGAPIAKNLPSSVSDNLAIQITPYLTFGEITNFNYDGYQLFTANITSDQPGNGQLMIAFDNNILCTNTLPTDGSEPTHTLQTLDYQFIYTPGTPDGKPRRDESDIADNVDVNI